MDSTAKQKIADVQISFSAISKTLAEEKKEDSQSKVSLSFRRFYRLFCELDIDQERMVLKSVDIIHVLFEICQR